MWGLVVGVGVFSGIVTFVINLFPDVGGRIVLFVAFGLILGLSWMIRGIHGLVIGLVAGAIVGAFNGIIVSLIESYLPEMTGVEKYLLELMKWVFPTMFNTIVGGTAWLFKNGV